MFSSHVNPSVTIDKIHVKSWGQSSYTPYLNGLLAAV